MEGKVMFHFLKSRNKNQQLEIILQKVQINMSNNYKDEAQANLKEFHSAFTELLNTDKLNEKQKAYYMNKLNILKEQMKNYTHKDQKTTW